MYQKFVFQILAEKLELWYYGNISRSIAIQLLKVDGDFLLRYAENKKCFVLTTQWDGMDKHFIIRKIENQVCCCNFSYYDLNLILSNTFHNPCF